MALLSELLIFKKATGSAVGVGMRTGLCATGCTCVPRGLGPQRVPFSPAAGRDTPRFPGRPAMAGGHAEGAGEGVSTSR